MICDVPSTAVFLENLLNVVLVRVGANDLKCNTNIATDETYEEMMTCHAEEDWRNTRKYNLAYRRSSTTWTELPKRLFKTS
jgi:hypothetical protein